MEQENIAQTVFDQMVCNENSQMLKAVLPYLPFASQKVLAAYTKTQELYNTIQLFKEPQKDMQICNSQTVDPVNLLNDIRRFSYGENRKRLEQAVNMLTMFQLLQTADQE